MLLLTLLSPCAAAGSDPTKKTYNENRNCNEYLGPQTMISLAYQLGVIPPADLDAVIGNLVADVAAHDYHLNVGIVGVKYLLPTLSQTGNGDVALMIAQARTPPSYIYMVEQVGLAAAAVPLCCGLLGLLTCPAVQGATTLWETWTGSRYAPDASWNHIMCAVRVPAVSLPLLTVALLLAAGLGQTRTGTSSTLPAWT